MTAISEEIETVGAPAEISDDKTSEPVLECLTQADEEKRRHIALKRQQYRIRKNFRRFGTAEFIVSLGSSYAFVKIAFDDAVEKAGKGTFEAVSAIARAGIRRLNPSYVLQIAKKMRKAVKRVIRETTAGPTVPERLATVSTGAFTDPSGIGISENMKAAIRKDFKKMVRKDKKLQENARWMTKAEMAPGECVVKFAEQHGKCPYCGRGLLDMAKAGNPITVDHLVPISRGGTSNSRNLVYCDQACNNRKGNMLIHEIIGDDVRTVPEAVRQFRKFFVETPAKEKLGK